MQNREFDTLWFDDRVEPYVDGELPPRDLEHFEERLEQDRELRCKVDVANRIRDTFRLAASPEIPDHVMETARHYVQPGEMRLVRPSRPAMRLIRSRPRVVAAGLLAAASLCAILVTRAVTDHHPAAAEEISPAEVDRALMEVKWTLALVSDMGDEREEIVNGHVVQPVQKAMKFVFAGDDQHSSIQ